MCFHYFMGTLIYQTHTSNLFACNWANSDYTLAIFVYTMVSSVPHCWTFTNTDLCALLGYCSTLASKDHDNGDNGTFFMCPNDCGRKYKYERSLNSHLRFECGQPKTFKCNICGKMFKRKHSCQRHMGLMHVGWF